MGMCSSKNAAQKEASPAATPGLQSPQQGAAPAVTPATAAAEGDGPARAESQEYPRTPGSPRLSAADDGTPQTHTYNSTEKPSRSAMRPSMEGRSPGVVSRKSSSGVSSVGFNVNIHAPEAETSKSSFAAADSISLKKIVDMFYDKVTAHPELKVFFDQIDMQKLKRHQVRFMGLAFGGKELVFEEDPNLNLRKVHYHLIRDKGLSLDHWEMFVGLFDTTLKQLEREIPEETRTAAMRSIRATKPYFVPIGQETDLTNSSIGALPSSDSGVLPAAAAAVVEQQQQQLQA